MSKSWIILLLALCLSQVCIAARIVRDADSSVSSDESSDSKEQAEVPENVLLRIKNADITLEQYQRLNAVTNNVKEWTPAVSVDALAQVCEILNPDQKASAVTLTAAQQEYFSNFVGRTKHAVTDSDKVLFTKNTICSYLHSPSAQEESAKALGLTISQYHRYEIIRTTGRENTTSNRVKIARKLCHVLQSEDNVANLGTNEAAELTPEQLSEVDTLFNEAKAAGEAERPKLHTNICKYLNEMISPAQQADVLGINIELYKKLVEIRKNHKHDESITGRLNSLRSACDEINKCERLLTNPVTENLDHTPEQLEEFARRLDGIRSAESTQRIELMRDTCVFLNKTQSVEEIGRVTGFTPEQISQIQVITRTRDPKDRSVKSRVKLVKRVCEIINPEDKLPQNEAELSGEQEQQFTEKTDAAGDAPLEQKLTKIRDVCTLLKNSLQ